MANYFLETQSHEWLLSNNQGAYALGTGNLVPQRKYHSLLSKSDNNLERMNLVGTIEEMIEWRGESFNLDSNHYNNCIFPEGFLHLVKSWLRPFPIFLFSSLPHNNDILIKKEIMMDDQTNTVLIKYTNLSAHKLHFKLKPKFTLRNHHHLNEAGAWDIGDEESHIWNNEDLNYFKVKRLSNQAEAFGWIQHGNINYNKAIYRNHYYPWEAMRGYPGVEDLLSLFEINFDLKTNESNFLLFSDNDIDNPNLIVSRIEKRYKKYPLAFDVPSKRKILSKTGDLEELDNSGILQNIDYDDNNLFDNEAYMKILELALSDFITKDDLIAGFPWFGAWGRDTMICLEAVNMLPKGAEISWTILQKYAENRKDGLIPNMCNESGQSGNYQSIDASLWFILRLYETIEILNKKGNQKQKLSNWKEIIDITENVLTNIIHSKHPGFQLNQDSFLELNYSFSSATWMDAKINDSPVTPRDGAPVEINALFFNALSYYELMVEQYNNIAPESKFYISNSEFINVKDNLKENFHKFWINDYLADRIYHGQVIKEYRPNAVIAASLPFTPLSLDKIQQIYECAHIELFTPYGLRTLSPRDSKFKKKYIGDVTQRDKAYHQGTVWAWLLLPFVKTWLRAFPNKSYQEANNHISYLIDKFRNGFMKGHIASIAEVWDGEKPHFPKGTPAQAWSVSALFAIETILKELEEKQ